MIDSLPAEAGIVHVSEVNTTAKHCLMTCATHPLFASLSRKTRGEEVNLGERVKQRRQVLKITQQQLAKALGMTPQHISTIEQNKGSPSLPVVAKLAEELGVTTDYLLLGKEGIVTDTIPAIKADKNLNLKAKNALISMVEELHEPNQTEED